MKRVWGVLLIALTVVFLPATAGAGPVAPLDDVRQVAAGGAHSCAVITNGQVRCWGANDRGQLGDGSTTDSPTPVRVRAVTGNGPLTGVSRVSTGARHTCARLTNGRAVCWGANESGELGTGDRQDRHRPAVVRGIAGGGPLVGVRSVEAGGRHTCAVVAEREARCWGSNGSGQLGIGRAIGLSPLPVPVVGVGNGDRLQEVGDVRLGGAFTCATVILYDTLAVRCWGANARGQLGNGRGVASTRPTVVVEPDGVGELQNIVLIGTGSRHACAINRRHHTVCWGDNRTRQLGRSGALTQSSVPVHIEANARQRLVDGGSGHTCVSENYVWCFGADDVYQDGAGTPNGPTAHAHYVLMDDGVTALVGASAIAVGDRHACAVLVEHTVRCWGENSRGQLGWGETGAVPYSALVHHD